MPRVSTMPACKARALATAAAEIASRFEIPLGEEFYTLSSSTVDGVLAAAKEAGYRKPRNASGSTACHYYAKLNRDAGRSYQGFV